MVGLVAEETREWISEVLREVLRDEDTILRLVARNLLWLEWNPLTRTIMFG
jgi:hypothetical protein